MTPPLPEQNHVRAYDVATIDAPGDGRTDFVFGDRSGRGSVRSLRFRPSDGPAWTAGFAVGNGDGRALDGIFDTPSQTWACVVMGGSAFLVNVLEPEASVPIETAGHVRDAVELVNEDLLLLASAWSIVAIGDGAVRWTTRRVSIESLRIDRVVDHELYGVADPEDEAAVFVVDLRTGAAEGGSG